MFVKLVVLHKSSTTKGNITTLEMKIDTIFNIDNMACVQPAYNGKDLLPDRCTLYMLNGAFLVEGSVDYVWAQIYKAKRTETLED